MRGELPDYAPEPQEDGAPKVMHEDSEKAAEGRVE